MEAPFKFTFGKSPEFDSIEELRFQLAQARASEAKLQIALDEQKLRFEEKTVKLDADHKFRMDLNDERLQGLFGDIDKLNATNEENIQQIVSLTDQLVAATAHKDDLKKRNDHLEKELAEERKRVSSQEADIHKYDDDLAILRREKTVLEELVDKLKKDFANEQKANESLDGQLANAYADLDKKETDYKKLRHEKDDADAQILKGQIDFNETYQQLQQAHQAIEELESYKTSLEELENEFNSAQTDLEDARSELADRDRTMSVKDARIQHLEAQVQKALEAKLTAEDAFSAQPTEAPPVIAAAGDSLEAELDAASDKLDYLFEETWQDRCAITDAVTVADIAPIANPAPAPKLSINTMQTTNIAPIAIKTSSISTQTSAPETASMPTQTSAPEAASTSTQTSAPEAASTSTQTSAPESASMSTQTSAPEAASMSTQMSAVEAASASTQTSAPAIIETRSRSTQTSALLVVKTKSYSSKTTRSSTRWLLALLAIFLYILALLQAHNYASSYGARLYSTGAYGNGRYLFGVYPVGFDIGHDWLSEQVCRTTSTAIATIEEWAGVTPTPLY